MRRPPQAPRPDRNGAAIPRAAGSGASGASSEPVDPADAHRATLESVFPAVPTSVSAARRFVAAALERAGVGPTTTDDAILATSELVTNALVHASGAIHVAVSVSAATVRVEVVDTDRHPQRVGPGPTASPQEDAVRGRGLAIVDALSTRWSAAPRQDGKVVWFELERH